MKNLIFTISIFLSTVCYANTITSPGFVKYTINDMHADPLVVYAIGGGYFEITKRCFSDQKWLLKSLPENVTFCGLEMSEGIWYENDLVCGGPLTRDYHFSFKIDQDCKDPLIVSFELLNAENQVEKELRTQVVTYSPRWSIQDWVDRERELQNPLDEMPKVTLCPRN